MTESLFVMASHGVLLEYTLETLPDVNNKDNICESSPIKLQVCYTIIILFVVKRNLLKFVKQNNYSIKIVYMFFIP